MITLYGVGGPNVAKTRASLLFKGLDFDQVPVDLIRKSDTFRQLTPIGRIPFISDDGLVVHDSLFIAEYLDRKYPDRPLLLPAALEYRVKAYTVFGLLERLFTIAAPLVAARLGFFELIDTPTAACSGYYRIDDNLSESLEAELKRRLGSLVALLDGSNCFAGGPATQADFAVFAFLMLLHQIGIPLGTLGDWMSYKAIEKPFDSMFANDNLRGELAI